MKIIKLFTIAAALALATGCHRHTHDDGEGDHGHGHGEEEEKTAQITVWTDRYEVFAEHKAPVAGKATTFITHVTDLQSLTPLEEGPVKFILRHGDEPPIEHLQAEPARNGIYLPGITFPKAGSWKLELSVEGKSVDLGTIEVFADKESASEAEFPEVPEGISLLKEQQWKIQSRTEPVQIRTVVEHIRLAAVVTPKPGSMASVVAPVAGRLLLPPNKPLPVPGQKVEAGDLLVLLQPTFSEQTARLLEAEAEAIRAKAAFDQAKLSYERTKKLAGQEAKSARELQEAEFNFKSAEAQYEAATALQATYKKLSPQDGGKKLDLSSVELQAPISGIISHVGSNLGEPVSPERVLFTILNPGVVWLEARLPEARLARLQQKPSAYFKLKDQSEQQPCKFVYLGMQIETATRTVPIAFEVQNDAQQLRIGQTLELLVETQTAENGPAIPDEAIVEEEGRMVAFVQVAGETFEKRDLTLGIRGGGFVQVLQGLKEGERVVTKGAYAIRLASVSNVIPAHGHAH